MYFNNQPWTFHSPYLFFLLHSMFNNFISIFSETAVQSCFGFFEVSWSLLHSHLAQDPCDQGLLLQKLRSHCQVLRVEPSRGDRNTCTLTVQLGFFLYASSIDCTRCQSTLLLTYSVSTSVKHYKSNLGAPDNFHQWQIWELQELMRTAILLFLHFLSSEVERSARTDRLWYRNFGENISYSYPAKTGQSHKQPEILCKSVHLTLRHRHAVVS